MTESISLAAIDVSEAIQCRVAVDDAVVAEYAEAMAAGTAFPPIVVFAERTDRPPYILADGFHRVAAARLAGIDTLVADIREGSELDAQLFAAGANREHGLRMSTADKRKAVWNLLLNEKSARWSDREIARHCGASHPFVAKERAAYLETLPDSGARTAIRNGKPYEINTKNIGATKQGKKSSVFRCDACGEVVQEHSWHCEGCGSHWPIAQGACLECAESAPTTKTPVEPVRHEPIASPPELTQRSAIVEPGSLAALAANTIARSSVPPTMAEDVTRAVLGVNKFIRTYQHVSPGEVEQFAKNDPDLTAALREAKSAAERLILFCRQGLNEQGGLRRVV